MNAAQRRKVRRLPKKAAFKAKLEAERRKHLDTLMESATQRLVEAIEQADEKANRAR